MTAVPSLRSEPAAAAPVARDGALEAQRVPYLRIRNLNKRFGEFAALAGIDLDIYPGEFVCFLGPSGCGKTTLLRAITGLDVQDSGTIIQAGRDISTLPVGRRDFGIVFQSYALFPNLTVHANVAYGLAARGQPRTMITARVAELLRTVGLADQAHKYPAQLSGGQQQRVALARALALAPGLLLLDEPLSALDARVRARLRGELRDLQQRLKVTTIMVTHDQEEALTMADRIVVMNQGRIEQTGTPADVYGRPATAFVADFIGKMNFLRGHTTAADRLHVAGAELACEPGEFPAGVAVTACIRPEDVIVRGLDRGAGNGAGNVFAARVGVMEFIGTHFATTLHVPGTHLNLSADFSMNAVRDLGIAAGKTINVALPPERLRVFVEPSGP